MPASIGTATDSGIDAAVAPVDRRPAGRRFRVPITTGIMLLILAMSVPFVVFFLIGLERAEKGVMERLVGESEVVIRDLDTRIRNHLDPVARLSHRLGAFVAANGDTLADPESFGRLVTGALSGLPQVREISLINAGGIVYRRNQVSSRVRVSDWSKDPGVQRLLADSRQRPEPRWGEFFFAESTQRTLLNFYQPLVIDGRFAGLLVAVVAYESLSEAIVVLGSQRLRNAFILYGTNQVLAHRNLSRLSVGLSDSQPLPTVGQIEDSVLAGYFGASRAAVIGAASHDTVSIDGVPFFVVYKPVTGFGAKPWLAGTYLPLSVLDPELDGIRRVRILGIALLALALAAAFVLGRRVTRPIADLAAAAHEIREKGFAAVDRRQVGGSFLRELDDAAAAFNTMRSGMGHLKTYVPEGVAEQLMRGGGGALGAETRDATVLFTDIVGFTGLCAKLPAAEIAELLNTHFSLLADCVRDEEGTIDKYIGDSMMAFWTSGDDAFNHAEHAFGAALSMASRLRQFNRDLRGRGLEPVRIRVGLHSGPVIVGNIGAPGRYNYTLIGDTVNVAERVEKLSKDFIGESRDAIVFATRATVDRIGPETEGFSIGSHLLRGRGQPMEIFRFC